MKLGLMALPIAMGVVVLGCGSDGASAAGSPSAENPAMPSGSGPSTGPGSSTAPGGAPSPATGVTPPATLPGPASGPVITPPANAVAVACHGDDGDVTLVKAGLEKAGAVVLSGTCNVGGDGITLTKGQFLGGPATLHYSGSGAAVQTNDDDITVVGLTFDGGGIGGNNDHIQGGWTIVNNTFQNITSGADGIHVDHILGGRPSVISHNAFINIWKDGYPNVRNDNDYQHCDQDCIDGSGIWFDGGLDQTLIDLNTFDKIGFNAIKGFFDNQYGKEDGWALTSKNIVISNNVMTNVHRIGIEFQGIGHGGCPGGCNYDQNPSDGLVMKGNYWHSPAFLWNAFAYSALFGGTNEQFINNVGIVETDLCYVRAGIALESGPDGGIVRGNVFGSVKTMCDPSGWAAYITDSYAHSGVTNAYQNNTLCGQDPGIGTNESQSTVIDQYNFKNDTCPDAASLATSNIDAAYSSPDHQVFGSGGKGTWSLAVVSTLSIRDVQFFLDDAKTPTVTQEVQDINPDFPSNRKWLYHATIDTTALPKGSHTLRAIATDVSGTAKTMTQTLSR